MLLLHQIICIVVGDDAVGAFELLGGVAVISAKVFTLRFWLMMMQMLRVLLICAVALVDESVYADASCCGHVLLL